MQEAAVEAGGAAVLRSQINLCEGGSSFTESLIRVFNSQRCTDALDALLSALFGSGNSGSFLVEVKGEVRREAASGHTAGSLQSCGWHRALIADTDSLLYIQRLMTLTGTQKC